LVGKRSSRLDYIETMSRLDLVHKKIVQVSTNDKFFCGPYARGERGSERGKVGV